ncbi:MAG: NAD(P)H-dependent oxidoreductase subunit E [Pseudonocardia sp.]|nr:NAD(P)H-dependent oxidoreductase subunit E [Pseudonocardia sp.]
MDLRLSDAVPSAAEKEAVQRVVAAHGGLTGDVIRDHDHFADSGHAARSRRHLLLPALHAVMDEIGYVSPGALNHVARTLSVPPADVYGVATFYAMYATTEQPPHVVHVCDDVACGPFGGEKIIAELADAGPGGRSTVVRSPCLGLCERAPAVLLQLARQPDASLAPATADGVRAALVHAADVEAGITARDGIRPTTSPADAAFADTTVSAPQTRTPRAERDGHRLQLLTRVGVVDPESLDDYRAHGGYTALRRALELGPGRVVRELTDSHLTGRGGAAFPTGMKWDGVAKAPERPHYLVCNADESEPGTFKDRVLLESDPFGLLEAMTIAGWVAGCERGYLYVRGEYPLATRRLENAIAAARRRGFLGPDVMGEGFAFDIELRRGAGAYVCGEETALLNAIEGYRGEPRNKPPFPSVSGLFGKPTVINNVETLYNVLQVLAIGGPMFAEVGGGRSTGSKLFCVSGAVGTPGVYEVDFGTTLRELLELAGGVRGELRTILLGGAAGGFVMPDQLDVALTLEGTREIGATLGSGVVLVFNTAADLTRTLLRIAAFFRDESCGQCVPCRVGTVRQEESLARIVRGAPRGPELLLLDDLARVMQDASICGLGQTAPAAVQSALALGLLDGPAPDGSRNGKVHA